MEADALTLTDMMADASMSNEEEELWVDSLICGSATILWRLERLSPLGGYPWSELAMLNFFALSPDTIASQIREQTP